MSRLLVGGVVPLVLRRWWIALRRPIRKTVSPRPNSQGFLEAAQRAARKRTIHMSLTVTAEPVPLTTDAHGVARVAQTRVTLDTVIEVYKAGSTPEEIARHYPSLQLADVYAVVTYYLRHRDEVEEYLTQRRQEAATIRRQAQHRVEVQGLRTRLLERLSS